ncbi:uncharacterized protein PITG_18682 [Phytophthora infestans T30-4]|uniref:Uncharacterized protein n=1 Tax=Phytophthora infestans (strain T30-4) TaxID=403677 RepID=D0NZB6_PHYIT|nr:uncharacterized protein PITG_18682 [Phytophthora infestans T30-4]EEY68925.1 conserved hypothetical protein [Phytophthora infestans T30-4]|eukprot:XP_002997311.1 conserved hypothetical protein [Phytophthora infestans T30-4]
MAEPGMGAQGPGPPSAVAQNPLPQEGRMEDIDAQQPQRAPETRVEENKEQPQGRALTDTTVTDEETAPETHSVTQAAMSTWSTKVQAHLPSQSRVSEAAARRSHMLAGVWNPVHIKQLLHTLMTDWEVDTTTWKAEKAAMRSEALAPANVSCDESIRAWTAREDDRFFT